MPTNMIGTDTGPCGVLLNLIVSGGGRDQQDKFGSVLT